MLEKLPNVVGRMLRTMRPGLEKIVAARPDFVRVPSSIEVTSAAFGDFAEIPAQFTADGEGTSPPIAWAKLPELTRSIVLIVEDADAPMISPLVHAIAWSIAPDTQGLDEGGLAGGSDVALMGNNSYLKPRWLPPDPPPGHGLHRYAFQVFALDAAPKLAVHPGRRAIAHAMRGHALARGLLIGTYQRAEKGS